MQQNSVLVVIHQCSLLWSFVHVFLVEMRGKKRKKFHSSINLKEEGRTLVCSWLKAPWVPCWWSASPGSWPPTSSASSVDFWHVKVIQVCQSQHGWMQPSRSSGTRHLVVRLRPIMTSPSPWWLPGAWGPQGQRDGIRQQLDWSHCHFQGRVSKQFIKQKQKNYCKVPAMIHPCFWFETFVHGFSKIAIKQEKNLSSLDILDGTISILSAKAKEASISMLPDPPTPHAVRERQRQDRRKGWWKDWRGWQHQTDYLVILKVRDTRRTSFYHEKPGIPLLDSPNCNEY